jgi:hypothetical protein
MQPLPKPLVPDWMREMLDAWITKGTKPPNDLLWAIITSDLPFIVAHTPKGNMLHHDVQVWLWNFAPAGSFGSTDAALRWERHFGQLGLKEGAQ